VNVLPASSGEVVCALACLGYVAGYQYITQLPGVLIAIFVALAVYSTISLEGGVGQGSQRTQLPSNRLAQGKVGYVAS